MHYVDFDKCQSDILDFTTGVRQESIIFYDDRFIIYICICMLRAISSTLLALVDHFILFFPDDTTLITISQDTEFEK